GACTPRMISAPDTTVSRAPTSAPASRYASSEMEASAPAPASTASEAPSLANLPIVSGVAATRLSPAASSFRIAILTRLPAAVRSIGNRNHDQQDEDGDDRKAPFDERDKARIGPLRSLHVICR